MLSFRLLPVASGLSDLIAVAFLTIWGANLSKLSMKK